MAENPSAFPHPEQRDCFGHGIREGSTGMTLRDAFAIAALPTAWDACDKGYFDGAAPEIAACAYQMADAMLAQRQKGGEA